MANAKGQITLHRLEQQSSSSKLHSMGELQFNNRNALCLSLDFSDRRGGHIGGYDEKSLGNDTSLIVSQSDGSLAHLPSLEAALSSTTSSAVDDVTLSLNKTSIHTSKPDEESSEDDEDNDWDRTSEDERNASLQFAHLWEGSWILVIRPKVNSKFSDVEATALYRHYYPRNRPRPRVS